MRDARVDAVADVHFVQIKCPLLTSERVKEAGDRGKTTVTTSGYASMGYSRGASAIGVAKALGEIGAEVGEGQVLKDWSLYSSVASCSAGIELMHNVVILFGASRFSASPFRIGHAVMRDAIDLPAVMQALESVGLSGLDVTIAKPARQHFRQGRGLAGRRHPGLAPYDARRFGHQRHTPRPRGGRRIDRRRGGNRGGLCLGRRGAPGPGRRRTGGGHRAGLRLLARE